MAHVTQMWISTHNGVFLIVTLCFSCLCFGVAQKQKQSNKSKQKLLNPTFLWVTPLLKVLLDPTASPLSKSLSRVWVSRLGGLVPGLASARSSKT
jgi:hypothetical protein